MNLHIDRTACDGRGLCVELLPERLGADDWGYPLSLDGSSEPEVTIELSRHAERAVAQCPRLALTLVRRIAVAGVGSLDSQRHQA